MPFKSAKSRSLWIEDLFLLSFFLLIVAYYFLETSTSPRIWIHLGLISVAFGAWFFLGLKGSLWSLSNRRKAVFIMFIIFGITMATFITYSDNSSNEDGSRNIVMAETFAQKGEFYEAFQINSSLVYQHSHRYSPLMPLYLSAFYVIFGSSIYVYKTATLLTYLFLLVVTFLTTRQLYGKNQGIMAAGIVAIIPRLWKSCGTVQTEPLSLAFYILIIWAILMSLRKRHYIVLAGLFAGLGYLTRSSVGFFFIVAGGIGFLWRFRYMKWGVVRDHYYLMAIGIFGFLVGIWSIRNIVLFWDGSFAGLFSSWQSDSHLSECLSAALEKPLLFAEITLIKIPWLLFLLSPWMFLISSQLPNVTRLFADEKISGIIISIAIPVIISSFICAIFSIGEGSYKNPILNFDNNRYVLVAVIPMVWYCFDAEKMTKARYEQRRPPQ